jgi:hypothetical protein
MQLVQLTLFAVRCLTASLHFIGALALFGVAGWLVWRLGHYGLLFVAAPFAWAGVVHVRRAVRNWRKTKHKSLRLITDPAPWRSGELSVTVVRRQRRVEPASWVAAL